MKTPRQPGRAALQTDSIPQSRKDSKGGIRQKILKTIQQYENSDLNPNRLPQKLAGSNGHLHLVSRDRFDGDESRLDKAVLCEHDSQEYVLFSDLSESPY